ncbi:hypothetical protein [Streptomyces sp. NPDC101249]|uniref:DUF6197 family protein n=1 Tax=Streptomyces sp. NPDC101249 TaxID=3366140 RepID=UPI00380E1106
MTTTTLAPTTRSPVLDLDARLALRDADMTARLDLAAVAFEVNTAHLPGADPIAHPNTGPHAIPAPEACPHHTPIAATLWHARRIILRDGWHAGHQHGPTGQHCLYGAIRQATPHYSQQMAALNVLLAAIRADYPDADSVPSWNDHRGTAALADRYLGRATTLAANRNQ